MIKKIAVSLVIIGYVGFSIACIAMQSEEGTEENNHEKVNTIIHARSSLKNTFDDFCFREDFYEMEAQKRYEEVWEGAKKRKKRMKYLETELKKEGEKPGEIEGEVTFRYHSLSSELERLEEEKEEIDKHFGGVNPLISDDEVEDKNVKKEEENPIPSSELEEDLRLLKTHFTPVKSILLNPPHNINQEINELRKEKNKLNTVLEEADNFIKHLLYRNELIKLNIGDHAITSSITESPFTSGLGANNTIPMVKKDEMVRAFNNYSSRMDRRKAPAEQIQITQVDPTVGRGNPIPLPHKQAIKRQHGGIMSSTPQYQTIGQNSPIFPRPTAIKHAPQQLRQTATPNVQQPIQRLPQLTTERGREVQDDNFSEEDDCALQDEPEDPFMVDPNGFARGSGGFSDTNEYAKKDHKSFVENLRENKN